MSYNALRKGRVSQLGLTYHITIVTSNREKHFATLVNGRKLVRVMKELHDAGIVESICFVVMPEHLHWLFVLQKGTLAQVVRVLKARSAQAVGHAIWQPNYYDHAVRKDEDLRMLARYIVANPLRANLVNSISEYSLWDAVCLDETLSG